MSILTVSDGPSVEDQLHHRAGTVIAEFFKTAGDATPAYNLSGALYLSESGYILMQVPNAIVRGIFSAMSEPGIELPPNGPDKRLNAHATIFRPEELEGIGGGDKITERGKQFKYSIGRLMTVVPDSWPGIERVWYLKVHSPELQALRRSYGLSSLPNEGKYEFHVTVAVRRRGILGRNDKAKS